MTERLAWVARAATLLAVLLPEVVEPSAQPVSLAVSPDTLEWVWSYDPPFVISNVGSDPLRLDSIDIGPCCEGYNPEYGPELQHAGNYYFGRIWRWPGWSVYQWDGAPSFPSVTIAPGESAELRVIGMDGCPICRSKPFDTWVDFQFWAGGNPDSLTRTFAYQYPVGVGDQPTEPSEVVRITGPNPFRDETEVTVRLAGGHVEISLLDMLGRHVRTSYSGHLGTGTHRIPVTAEGLSPGLFFVRAVFDSGRTSVMRALTLVR